MKILNLVGDLYSFLYLFFYSLVSLILRIIKIILLDLALLFISELDLEIKLLSRVISPFEEEIKRLTDKFLQTKDTYSSLYQKKCQINESNKVILTKIEVCLLLHTLLITIKGNKL